VQVFCLHRYFFVKTSTQMLSKYSITSFLLLIFTISQSFAQYDEYTYWSVTAGMNHKFITHSPSDFTVKSIEIDGATEQLFLNSNKYKKYGLGYVAGVNFHKDFKTDKAGLAFGVNYSTIPQTYEYLRQSNNSILIARNLFHTANAEVSFKYGGKEFYDRMRYFQIGGSYGYRFAQSEKIYSSDNQIHSKITNTSAQSFSTFLAFNWMFFNLKVNYSLEIRSSEQILYLSTSVNLPLNSWTCRDCWWQRIKPTYRRWFR